MTNEAKVTWRTVRLGQLLTDIQPGFASGKHNTIGEGIPHFRPMNVSTDGRIERSVLKYVEPDAGRPELRLHRGDVVFNNTNSPELVGKTALFEDDDAPAFSNHMTRLRTNREALDPAYLALRLHHAWREGWFAAHCNNHVSQASIGRDVLRDFEIELPPITTQQNIVALHHQVDSHRVSSKSHLSFAGRTIMQFRQAVLAAACSGRLTESWRDSHPNDSASELIQSLKFSHDNSNDRQRLAKTIESSVIELEQSTLPDSWSTAALRTLCQPGRPITYGILKPGPHVEDGVPYVRVTDFKSGIIKVDAVKRTAPSIAEEYRRSKLHTGDLLFAIRGTYGHVAIVPAELDGANITQDTARLSIDSRISREYVMLALRSPDVQNRVARAAKGVAVQGINLGDLKELLLPLPPVDEQREIARRVDQLLSMADVVYRRVMSASKQVDYSSRAVLAKAYRGELIPELAHSYDDPINSNGLAASS